MPDVLKSNFAPPGKGYPNARQVEAAWREAQSGFRNALRACKYWVGPGTDLALLDAMKVAKSTLDYVTYLYLSYRYKKTNQELQEKLSEMQWKLFEAYSTLMQVAQRRNLLLDFYNQR